ncbi:MAG: hypothetical protein B9S34_03160 [Opitutia bacterium Tous-C1TDCM]|nr:MAG: hypothetical protein B9S34_03160 [Opitutae bacterium Tous-C1TDCM]
MGKSLLGRPMDNPPRLSFHASRLSRFLWWVAGGLVGLNLVVQFRAYGTGNYKVEGLFKFLHLDVENNLPTFFATLLLLLAAGLLATIARLERRRRAVGAWNWIVLATGFLVMSADEAISLHERLNEPIRRLLSGSGGRHGWLFFAWTIPGLAVVTTLGLVFLKFLFRLPARISRAFVLGGTLYVSGIIGMELICGRYAEIHGVFNLTYSLLATVEESLEMAGVIVFVRALLVYLADTYGELKIDFGAQAAKN